MIFRRCRWADVVSFAEPGLSCLLCFQAHSHTDNHACWKSTQRFAEWNPKSENGYETSTNVNVAAVSNLALAAGDWQSVSSRGRAHKSSQWRVEREEVSRGTVLRSARCVFCQIKACHWAKPLGAWLVLGAGGGNPRVAAWILLQWNNTNINCVRK